MKHQAINQNNAVMFRYIMTLENYIQFLLVKKMYPYSDYLVKCFVKPKTGDKSMNTNVLDLRSSG